MSTKTEKLKKSELEAKKNRKRKIKWIIIIAAAVLLITAAIVYFIYYSVDKSMTVGIEGVDLYYGETAFRVRCDFGKPDRIGTVNYEDVETAYYYEDLSMFQSKGELEIVFVDGRAKYVNAVVEKNKDTFEHIIENMSSLYENREGYEITDKELIEAYQYCSIYASDSKVEFSVFIDPLVETVRVKTYRDYFTN
ncbi:MAG: hypothetical protein IJT70_07260 [Clostridia bacterium]|nr:hypothetical protein [Clostridia bacterium]